jgi:hypothetical protein
MNIFDAHDLVSVGISKVEANFYTVIDKALYCDEIPWLWNTFISSIRPFDPILIYEAIEISAIMFPIDLLLNQIRGRWSSKVAYSSVWVMFVNPSYDKAFISLCHDRGISGFPTW